MNRQPVFDRISDGSFRFLFGNLDAGSYRAKDEFKPYLHPLKTPSGHTLSLGRPHDHPHHKALMFALQTSTHNYWEEYPLTEDSIVGRQIPQGDVQLETTEHSLRLSHVLHWMGEGEASPQIIEERVIECSFNSSSSSFEWQWKSLLVPQVEVTLVKSPYSPEIADGNKVNYHGLGIRLRREFGCTGGNEVRLGKRAMPVGEALGQKTSSVSFVGSIDEIWPVPRCSVTFASKQPFGVFAMDSPFAYLAYGPSVLDAPVWKAGKEYPFSFKIRVADEI